MKFETGERVIVRTYKRMPINWNEDMFELMGKIVTISKVRHSNERRTWPYVIKEEPNWVWRERDFISLDGETDPNILFLMRKL
jgi:hypothetical protein